MHFALLGNHPDGLNMARALVQTHRYEFAAYMGPANASEALQTQGLHPHAISDIEEILADPAIQAVIVASPPSDRANHLRRALQSERHVLCVYPPDDNPDIAYEANLIQGDTGRILLPLLSYPLHPGVARLASLGRDIPPLPGGSRLVKIEESFSSLTPTLNGGFNNSLRLWEILRALCGEITEVMAFSSQEKVAKAEPLLLAGLFERGDLFQATLVPGQNEPRWSVKILGSQNQAEMILPLGFSGPANLTWRKLDGQLEHESWQAWDPWPAFVAIFEKAITLWCAKAGLPLPGDILQKSGALEPAASPLISWQDAIRCLELDDAAHRSLEKRRSSTLEYQEANEEVGFKGTMTLVGCGILWGMILLAILSAWAPRLGWVIIPVLIGFLALQLLRWIIPHRGIHAKSDRLK